MLLRFEKDINRELLSVKKSNDISGHLYSKLRSTESQPARLYDLAKIHKKDISLRPVLSLPGWLYENLNKIVTFAQILHSDGA